MILIKNIKQLLTLEGVHKKNGRHTQSSDLSIIEDAFIIFDQHKIYQIGKSKDLKSPSTPFDKEYNGRDLVILPAITDCHTHTVFAGNRAKEYVQRLAGVSYEEIAKQGGGINHTTNQTRVCSNEDLISLALARLMRMYSFGVNNVEIKSGYGLSIDHEIRISNIISKLKTILQGKMTLFNTFMAAHAIPPEAKSSDEYIEQVVLPIMTNKELVKSFDFVDIFHEKNYFNTNNCRNLFDYAKLCKIPVKIHADELNDNGGAELAVQYDAVSADHLMCINDTAIKKISQSKTVAVMLPGTSLFLGKKLAPARMLIDSGSILAIASDFNPGSCHFDNLLLLAAMSAPMLKLNIAETIAGITYNAAKAVARNDLGHLCVGGPPNMSLFKCDSYEQIFYNWGYNYSVNNQFNFNQSFI